MKLRRGFCVYSEPSARKMRNGGALVESWFAAGQLALLLSMRCSLMLKLM